MIFYAIMIAKTEAIPDTNRYILITMRLNLQLNFHYNSMLQRKFNE